MNKIIAIIIYNAAWEGALEIEKKLVDQDPKMSHGKAAGIIDSARLQMCNILFG